MKARVAINGFGRIGRNFYRASLRDREFQDEFEIVAVNDVTDSKTLAHLLKYDSILRKLDADVEAEQDSFTVNGKETVVLSERDSSSLPWESLSIDYVLEATGLFTNREDAAKHITAGAKKVVITAPAKNPDVTIVLGVNQEKYDIKKHHIVSMASCTTNCIAPLVKVLNDNFGLEYGLMSTCHAYTNDQRILDLPHRDLRRARAACLSIIPTTTGAARSVAEVIPELRGKLDGVALRVPVPDGSIVDLVAQFRKEISVEDINGALKKAAESEMKGIMQYTEEPLVSSDVIGNPYSAVVDSEMTMVIGKFFAKIFAWYDNEWAFSCRLVDLVKFMLNRDR
ncbi:MAG: type I glyceraldehyde-3-phosphate dehydrogenase [Candidatus Bathyarchaeota archaeon]|nr:type I glyceraldehyde-3-phosphate dehydrogenase [Candidatus Bathyarchaeota archaeon]